LPREDRRSSGVGGLDQAMEGGYPLGTTIVVIGSPLTGIEHIARQFWRVNDEPGTYLMIDAEVEEGMIDAKGIDPAAFIVQYKGDRIVVDSLSSLILDYGIDKALDCMIAAEKEVASRDANIMFILYPELHTGEQEFQILRRADVVIELKEVIFMNEIERQLAVHKAHKMAVPKRLIPFNITEKGIELSTTSRVV
jgi:KaiC/GvpD/RAD55 family RecA-like ATPase